MLKKIVLALVVLFSFVILMSLGLLIPAHFQVRSVPVEIPSVETLEQAFIDLDQSQLPVDISFINTASQETPFGKLGHVGVLITWANETQFLIDAGMNREEAEKFGSSLELLGAGKTQTFGPIQEQLGGYIDYIKGIGFTHLHTDHTFGVTDICIALSSRNMQATIFQTVEQSELHNHFTSKGQDFINESACEKRILDEGLLKPVDGFPGLFAISAGGHTPGSTVFVTKWNEQIWIFAGDLTNAMSDIHNNKDKGFAYSYILVPENTKLLQQWRLWLKQAEDRPDVTVLVAHDINAFEAQLNHWQEEQ